MPKPDPTSNQPVNILIAEDSPTQSQRLQFILERNGFEVTATPNGQRAWEAAQARKPTLVISDIVMPEMDGYQLCKRIKSDPHLNHVPVILVTTLADPHDVIRGLECRADNFITKPYDERYLLSRVQFVLLNRQICEHEPSGMGVEIFFNEHRHFITADRLQILNLLLSTYEAAVQRNHELTRIKDELRAAHAIAEAATNAKSQFLANMSHEIRTPMTAILGYADLLQDPDLTDAQRRSHINVIRRNGEHLLTVINDILDISKIEAGKMEVEKVACSPWEILVDVVSLMRVRAVEKNLDLEIGMQGQIPSQVQSDPLRLRQILINLVGNAVKFTQKGGVRVEMRLEDRGAEKAHLRFDISDTGIGLTPAEIERLFKPFAQADSTTTRRYGGTGLGLSICHRLAAMLGGTIEVNSAPGRGSVFSVLIDPGPLDAVQMISECSEVAAEPSPSAPPFLGLPLEGRVLLVDDGHDNRELLSFYLRKAGAQVVTADNGRKACDIALDALHNKAPFDLILMDIQLPELDGYSATELLRSRGYSRPIVALTAHAMKSDRDKCLKAGCNDHLTKPVRRDDLLALVARYLLSAADTPTSDGVLRSSTDDKEILEFVAHFVAKLPHQARRLMSYGQQRDRHRLLEVVHQIKGSAGMFGFGSLTTHGARLMDLLLSNGPWEQIEQQLTSFIELLRRVEGYDTQVEAQVETNDAGFI